MKHFKDVLKFAGTTLLLSVLILTEIHAQQGFTYQAVARNSSGSPIVQQPLNVRIAVMAGGLDGEVVWQEDHAVETSPLGLFTLTVGGPDATNPSGTAGSFDQIDWSANSYFLHVWIQTDGAYMDMGGSPIQTVPMAQYAASAKNAAGNFSVQANEDYQPGEALFEVRRKDGQPVFAVYEDMVWVYVDTTATKGVKGGFAVGGYNRTKGVTQEYLRVTSDSVRVYVDNDPAAKGVKGGFAVGGYNRTKGASQEFLRVTPDSVRVYIDTDPYAKGVKGGFAVGGYNRTKALGDDLYLNVSGRTDVQVVQEKSQVMWYPLKDAFLAGNIHIGSVDSVGQNSTSLGYKSVAMGRWSQAFGYKSMALGDYSTAIGRQAMANISSFAFGNKASAMADDSYAIGSGASATGNKSFAIGVNSTSSGYASVALGYESDATNNYAVAIGYHSIASGNYSHAFGLASTASGDRSMALGMGASSDGYRSLSLGYSSSATNNYSVAMGYQAASTGPYATAIGYRATASYDNSYAIGKEAQAKNQNAFALGDSSIASGSTSISIGSRSMASGTNSVALGNHVLSSSSSSIAIGNEAEASGSLSTALGYRSIAAGTKAISIGAYYYKTFDFPIIIIPPIFTFPKGGEGPDLEVLKDPQTPKGTFVTLPLFANRDNQATGEYSMAVGNGNRSENGGITFGVYNDGLDLYSTAIGFGNQAVAPYSLAAGFANRTEGKFSTAIGRYTSANAMNTFVIGTYNVSTGDPDDWVATDPLFQIGNGASSSETHDAFRVNKNGGTYINCVDNVGSLWAVSQSENRTGVNYGIISQVVRNNATASYYSGYFYDSGSGGTYNGLYADQRSGGGIDVAEYILDTHANTEAGDVVVADEDHAESVVKSSQPYQASVLGVVSTKPHMTMGMELVMDEATGEAREDVHAARLALNGRVPVKVTDENGPIEPGDLLTTSSTAGYAMKWTLLDVRKAKDFEELKSMLAENERRRNAVIGKAVGSLTSGMGSVVVLISLQ